MKRTLIIIGLLFTCVFGGAFILSTMNPDVNQTEIRKEINLEIP